MWGRLFGGSPIQQALGIAVVVSFLKFNLDFNVLTEKFQLKSSEKYAKKNASRKIPRKT